MLMCSAYFIRLLCAYFNSNIHSHTLFSHSYLQIKIKKIQKSNSHLDFSIYSKAFHIVVCYLFVCCTKISFQYYCYYYSLANTQFGMYLSIYVVCTNCDVWLRHKNKSFHLFNNSFSLLHFTDFRYFFLKMFLQKISFTFFLLCFCFYTLNKFWIFILWWQQMCVNLCVFVSSVVHQNWSSEKKRFNLQSW